MNMFLYKKELRSTLKQFMYLCTSLKCDASTDASIIYSRHLISSLSAGDEHCGNILFQKVGYM